MKKKSKPFNVILNPLTREVTIERNDYTINLSFEDIDEWQGFDHEDGQYDARLYYEDGEGVQFSIYPVVNNKGEYETLTNAWEKVNLKLEPIKIIPTSKN